ncbi:MAG: Cytosine-specific methyltransferase, partial [Candidatus Moranbacteria bacterium GW2011_GWF1_36_4]
KGKHVVIGGTKSIEKKEVNVKSFKEGFLPFPKLSLGSYQIAVRGKYQDTEDGLILPLNVISSRLDFELSKIQNLSPNDKFKLLQNLNYKSDKPLTLTITDIGRGKYYHTLKGYCYIRSNRVENKLVTILSGQILRDKFENEDYPKELFSKENWIPLKKAIGDLEKLEEGGFDNHFWSKAKKNNGQGNNIVSALKPGPTMRTEHHGNIEYHYNGKRRLSAREAARIQSFPDDFIFFPSTSSAYKQVGNAVPPVMAWHIATAIQKFLDKNLK